MLGYSIQDTRRLRRLLLIAGVITTILGLVRLRATADIQIGDMYVVISFFHVALAILIWLLLLCFMYWAVHKGRVPSIRAINFIHVAGSLLCAVAVPIGFGSQAYLQFDPSVSKRFSEPTGFSYIHSMLVTVGILLFVIIQCLWIIHLVIGLILKFIRS